MPKSLMIFVLLITSDCTGWKTGKVSKNPHKLDLGWGLLL